MNPTPPIVTIRPLAIAGTAGDAIELGVEDLRIGIQDAGIKNKVLKRIRREIERPINRFVRRVIMAEGTNMII